MMFRNLPIPSWDSLPGLILCCMLLALPGCSKETLSGSSAAPDSGQPDNGTPPFTGPDPNQGIDVRQRAAAANSYAITYGALNQATIDTLKTYPLVIVHPYNGNITRDQVMLIKQGIRADDPSDNPVVLCYISIGEDSRTFQKSDAELLADPRFRGDGSGPSVDPRGPAPSGRSLLTLPGGQLLPAKGTPTNGGLASYYLHDNQVACGFDRNNPRYRAADENYYFKARFVNAGDPSWYETLKDMHMDPTTHTPPGLNDLLGTTNSLGCDGVFLDTIDTAAPNKYTADIACGDANYTHSEWTAKGFSDFIRRLRGDYPDKVILQNRGLFFFDPREPHYQVSARGAIDIAFFESYHLDNDSAPGPSRYFEDNKYNSAPKLMAEANRPDGFKVLSLGYASGFTAPKPGIDIQTLFDRSVLGLDILTADINEAHSVGFRHYITNAQVDLVNSFVKNHANMTDISPPVWSSVYNASYNPPAPMAPRVGIQAVSPATGSVTVSWDVALDMNRVSYALYYQAVPFDFANDPDLRNATRMVLSPAVGAGYADVWNHANPSLALEPVFPYRAEVGGLQPGTTYYFVLRAVDSKGNEEKNRQVRSAVVQ